ncbi:uncharacterized protein LOC100206939 isoform X2 [Hydra vulgaris]|uniref:Uncharacterized protein LOC100206939 isoform X2 n=1 Tax=Hydra vulgaris TaxID=6087 RepID=A0ABM4DQL4_HYDVU
MEYDWKKAIYDILQNAGSVGLLFDDIKNILGIHDSNLVQGLLTELHSQYLIEFTSNQHYRLITGIYHNYPAPMNNINYSDNVAPMVNQPNSYNINYGENVAPMANPSNSYNVNYGESIQQQMINQPKSAVPVIYLPGTNKFCSYKNSLQEYCQKSRLPTPSYKVVLSGPGMHIGNVTFNNTLVHGTVAYRIIKEAENNAAFEALKQLGYLHENSIYIPIAGVKRPNDTQDPWYSKKPKTGLCSSFKSKLNELAQKRHLGTPTYQTIYSAGGYLSTVVFNGREFKGMSPCMKKKDAEQNAAYVAYNVLSNDLSSLPPVKAPAVKKPPPVKNSQPMISFISQNQDQKLNNTEKKKPMVNQQNHSTNASLSLSSKNRLQEYCQRLKKALPQYKTASNNDKTMVSTVIVEGVHYQGEPKVFKKEAELSAASIALKALGLAA